MTIAVTRSEKVPIEKLTPHDLNPNKGNVALIRESLRMHGQYRAIVVREGTFEILAGNHTYHAAVEEGLEEMLVDFVDVTDEEAKKILLVDNASRDQADYDLPRLREILESLDDFDGTGFQRDDLDKIRRRMEAADRDRGAEIEFASELLESHNYVVLYFDNDVDWQTAQEVLGIESAKALDFRKGYERAGVGRVIRGSTVIRKIQGT